RDCFSRVSLTCSLIGHRSEDVGAKGPVIGTVGSTQPCNVVTLCQASLPRIVCCPPRKLSEFSEGNVELLAGGLVVRRLIEKVSNQPELLPAQPEHCAATADIIHCP